MQPNLEAELKVAALAAGLIDVDLLPLIKRDGIAIAADGAITGIPEAIAAFRTAKPNYFRIKNLSAPDYRASVRSAQRNLRDAGRAPAAEKLRALAADGTDVRSLDRASYLAGREQASRLLRRAKI